jgi:superfamily II DNA or RNA helicase
MNNKGYIYIRTHESYNIYNAVKLGKTDNIPDRESNYITCEIIKGHFIIVIAVDYFLLNDIEIQLKQYFASLGYHIYHNGGTEFLNKEIINKIIPFFESNNIKYKLLNDDDINQLIRKDRNNNIIKPREDQLIIINNLYSYLQYNDKALLVLICGIGKTLISLWTIERLKYTKIIIGVPNILLLNQWYYEINRIMKGTNILLVKDNITINNISDFIKNNNKHIIITTYSSSYKIVKATTNINHIFDIKIYDECHHLTSSNMETDKPTKTFIEMIKINSIKQISLTATIKNIDSSDESTISNDNIKYFGNIVDKRCLLWSINNNIVCDYIIQTIYYDDNDITNLFVNFNIIDDNNKRLFLSAYSALKSINDNNSHHLLIYCNNIDNSKIVINYIKKLLEDKYFNINDLSYNYYHSNLHNREQNKILNNYNKSNYGIISCVYCLTEGYDNVLIDGVIFSENMTSNIRIVQSALRAFRKNKLEPTKISKIILPILNINDLLNNNENIDLKKIREIIYQMSLEDETIIQKIKVFKFNINNHNNKLSDVYTNKIDFGIYDDKLTQKLKLKIIPRYINDISYEKAKLINKEKLTDKSKKAYYELCNQDIRLSKNPEEKYKNIFDWIDYLNIEKIYYDINECHNKINEYLILYPNIKQNNLDLSFICNELCNLDNKFPPNDLWCEYYQVNNLNKIIKIVLDKKNKGLNI